jgi:Na+-translocating ferredoxin:NAD+ oxidoreductase RnfD subunit
MSQVRAFLKTPKGYVLVVLLLLMAIATFHPGSWAGWLNAAAAIAGAVAMDVAFALGQERKRIFPDGAVLTGLIVAMVLSTSVPWYICGITGVIADLSKHLFKVKRKPIFNPAAFGLAVAIALFGSGQSWWGGLALLPAWATVAMLAGGLLVTRRVNKFPAVFAFVGTYFVLLLAAAFLHVNPGIVADAFRMPFTSSVLFLAFFMVTDPPTSPAQFGDQLVFGIMAAVISAADYLLVGGLLYLLLGLLAANAWEAWRAWVHSRAASGQSVA